MDIISSKEHLAAQDHNADASQAGENSSTEKQTSATVSLAIFSGIYVAIAAAIGALFAFGILAVAVAVPIIAILAAVAATIAVSAAVSALGSRDENEDDGDGEEPAEPCGGAEEPRGGQDVAVEEKSGNAKKVPAKHKRSSVAKKYLKDYSEAERDAVAKVEYCGTCKAKSRQSGQHTDSKCHLFRFPDGRIATVRTLERLSLLRNLKEITVPAKYEAAALKNLDGIGATLGNRVTVTHIGK
jgi:hypothetical protein